MKSYTPENMLDLLADLSAKAGNNTGIYATGIIKYRYSSYNVNRDYAQSFIEKFIHITGWSITLHLDENHSLFDFEHRHGPVVSDDTHKWLRDNQVEYYYILNWTTACFIFMNEADAILFKMRYG